MSRGADALADLEVARELAWKVQARIYQHGDDHVDEQLANLVNGILARISDAMRQLGAT